jgi:hypothetical protein
MTDAPRPPCRLFRDASKRLVLDLDREYPTRDVDAGAVRRVLIERFGAQFGESWEDPLGDAAAVEFQCGPERFELWWDHWIGLCVLPKAPSGEGSLQRFAEYWNANPPPLR